MALQVRWIVINAAIEGCFEDNFLLIPAVMGKFAF
jgi:hypothetical protein